VTTALLPVIISRLEKAAVDNGFDQELPRKGGWLGFASTQCPLRVWLSMFGDTVFLAAFSQLNVARALGSTALRWPPHCQEERLVVGLCPTYRRCTGSCAEPSS
jgi:hypothetical protein